jgi:ribA/ribD-fused uncharacterized protein
MKFENEYSFLGNDYSCKVCYDDEIFPCVETAYQYAKCADDHDHELFMNRRGFWVGGSVARSVGRKVKLRDDWVTERVDVMKDLLEQKFIHNEYLREALKLTGRIEIVDEEHGEFWGTKNGKGLNVFGKLVMKIRDDIQKFDGFPLKVIVAGSRSFDNYQLLCEKMDYYLKDVKSPVIVSGHAKGADLLGEKYAIEHNLPGESYPADWEHYGKQAGYIRNELMAQNADVLVAFWNGTSKGTEHMIRTMKSLKKPVRIVRYV